MKLPTIAVIFIGAICMLPGMVNAITVLNKFDMFVGEIKVMDEMDIDRVAIGNGALLKVKILPKSQLLIIAEKEGSTSLRLWHKDGRQNALNIRIAAQDPERRVRLEDMIKMDVKIIEFRKAALKSLGINWQKSIDGPTAAFAKDWAANDLFRGSSQNEIFDDLPNRVSPLQGYFGIATEITSRINYLASNGDAFTLAEPNLSCINGGSAEFLAGGEVPIPIRGPNGEIVITYKKYGIQLEIKPVAGPNGVISAELMTEVSQLDQSVNVMGAPGFLTRRTSTQMNVHDKETIVISGLLNSENAKDVNKVPLLGDIPVLGHLFKSTDFRDSQTELAIFVTPRIVYADTQSNVEKIAEMKARSEKRVEVMKEQLEFNIID